VPTRRELASYGIKLPSQRLAEERARQAEHQHYDDDALTDEEVAELEQGELARQFAAAQNQRYGDSYAAEEDDVDEDSAAEAELARQFAASQQQRYASEQPPGSHPFSAADYEFSPMKTLVDDTPSEPVFTPLPEVQQPAPQYQQPAQHSQPVQQPMPHQQMPQPPQHAQQPAAAAGSPSADAAAGSWQLSAAAGSAAADPAAAGKSHSPAVDAQWRQSPVTEADNAAALA
jgi:S-DNA-T family DNA segregation ATPase FtsK/SpoIIIE